MPLRLGPEILRDLDSDNRSRMGFLESMPCGRVSRSHIAEIALQEGKFVVFFSVAIGTPSRVRHHLVKPVDFDALLLLLKSDVP